MATKFSATLQQVHRLHHFVCQEYSQILRFFSACKHTRLQQTSLVICVEPLKKMMLRLLIAPACRHKGTKRLHEKSKSQMNTARLLAADSSSEIASLYMHTRTSFLDMLCLCLFLCLSLFSPFKLAPFPLSTLFLYEHVCLIV